MIKITESEATTLEAIKCGCNVPQIVARSIFAEKTIRGHILSLIQKKVIVVARKESYYNKYALTGNPYTVIKPNYSPRVKLTFEPGSDKLLDNALNKQLTDDELFYLQQHRKQKRSILAKRLGLSKLEINFALERLG